MTFPQTINASASPEVQVNDNFSSIAWTGVYSHNPVVSTGLNRGYNAGRWGGFAYAGETHTFGNGATTYVSVVRATGALNFSTSSANYNNALTHAKLETIVTSGGVVTSAADDRAGPGGAFGPIAGGGVELRGLTFTSDTGSTADSDPGNGLFKWNNATQASATVLYFDNQTVDGVSLTTFWASLAATGFITLQQADDATKWQEWKWTALPVDGTGYRKFTVTLQASGGSIADDKTVLVDFESGQAGLGTLSTQNANAVAITGGDMSGMTTVGGATVTATTKLLSGDGSLATPSFAFSSDQDVGLYLFGANTGAITAGSAVAALWNASAFLIWDNLLVGVASDANLSRVSAGLIGVGTGAAGSTAGSLSLTNLTASARVNLGSFTVGTLPAAGAAGGMIYVSDAGGNGPCMAVSNGSAWKRCDNTSTTVV